MGEVELSQILLSAGFSAGSLPCFSEYWLFSSSQGLYEDQSQKGSFSKVCSKKGYN